MKNNLFIKNNKSLIMIIILLLSWFGFVFFLVLPAKNLLRDNFIAVEKKMLDIEVDREKINNLPELKSKSDLIDRDREVIEVIFSKEKIVELVNDLELIAEKTGNKIDISVSEEEKILEVGGNNKKESDDDAFIKSLPVENYFEVNIILRGDYNSLMNFINKLNNLKYYNAIKSFDLKTEKEKIGRSDRGNDREGTINLLNSDGTLAEVSEEDINGDKIFLKSKLVVLFYLLEKENEKK